MNDQMPPSMVPRFGASVIIYQTRDCFEAAKFDPFLDALTPS